MKKKYLDEVSNYREKIILLEDKLKESNIKIEKINKHKETKNDNKNEHQHNKITNEKIKEILSKDKQTYQNQIDKLYKEIKSEKQKYLKSEENIYHQIRLKFRKKKGIKKKNIMIINGDIFSKMKKQRKKKE